MLREGFGNVKPRSIEVPITPRQVQSLWDFYEELQEYRGYARSESTWKKGLIEHPPFWGLLGEQAVATWLNRKFQLCLAVDTMLRPRGDGGKDLVVFGQVLQIKNRTFGGSNLLVRREDAGPCGFLGRTHALTSAIYVKTSCPVRGSTSPNLASIDGWIEGKELIRADFKAARRGDHRNLELDDCLLQCPVDLIKWLDVCRRSHAT